MDVQTYLKRIGYDQPIYPDMETLLGVHRAHLLTVPFENLDIHLGIPIRLSEQALWDKIIVHRRGGFCYELNGMFAWMLKQIGFEVTYLNGRVYNSQGTRGRMFDHLALLVRVPTEERCWLADVGFGDSFIGPLRFGDNHEQAEGRRAFRLDRVEDGFNLSRQDFDGQWTRQYFFDTEPRTFPADYEEACLYHQTSPLSSFTREQVISLATPEGRITLDDHNLTITVDGKRRKRKLKDQAEFSELLRLHFGIEI